MFHFASLRKIIAGFVIIISVATFPGLVLQTAHAGVWSKAWGELRQVGVEAGFDPQYREGGLQIFIARIIQQLLTFLGIIFFILVLYAGFLWLTSAGNEEAIGKSKKVLSAAGIGLGIVVLAYAITVFVLRAFLRGAGLDTLNP